MAKTGLAFMLAALAMVLLSAHAAADDSSGDTYEDAAKQYSTMNKTQYEAEVMKLETWKSKVRGTQMGERLISYLTTLDANLVRNSRDVNSLYKRGYLYGTVGCTRAALADLSKAINVDGVSSQLRTERAICYMDMGEYTLAKQDLDLALSENPCSGDARLARGRLNLILNQALQALPDLLACKESSSEFMPALPDEVPANFYRAPDYYLGVCYDLLGSHEKAIEHYKEAAKDVTGADSGYIHRYADRPLDAEEKANSG